MTNNKLKIFALLLFVCLNFTSVCKAEVNIAVIAPKVGDTAKYGQEIIEGAQIAVDIINSEGGILGKRVNLVAIDDRCEDSFAVSAAQMMTLNSSAKDKMSLVIGPFCNNNFADVSKIYSDGKIVRMSFMPLSAKEFYIKEKGLFKIGGLMSEQAKAFFDFYKNKSAGKNVAMVYDSMLPQTTETAFELQKLFRENGFNNLTLFDFADCNESYLKTAKEILLNNQIVYVLGKSDKLAGLVQRLQEENPEVVIFTDDYMANDMFFRELGNFVEGVYLLRLKNLKDSPNFTEDLVKLRLLGKEPKGLGVYSYTAVNLWRQMAENAKSYDMEKIQNKINAQEYETPWGNVAFENGNATNTVEYSIYRIENGEYAQVN